MSARRRSRPDDRSNDRAIGTAALLGDLGRLVMPPSAAVSTTLIDACAIVRAALDAADAYVVRAGDPHFVRADDEGDPTGYEITQKGYFLVWRELAAQPQITAGLFNVTERRVHDPAVLAPGSPSTHLALLMPNDESTEMLVVRGPWPRGLTDDQVAFVTAARPMLTYLVGTLFDTQRRQRQREQLESLSTIAAVLMRDQELEPALHALATAVAKASGFDWATLTLMDEDLERVTARVINTARYSGTPTEVGFRTDARPLQRALDNARHIAATRRPLLYPSVFAQDHELPLDADLLRYYERGHVLSLATFPLWSGARLIGTLSFSSGAARRFDADEVAFLTLLSEQTALAIEWLQLHRQLSEANAALARAATHDALTGLPNRTLFLDRLAHTLARAQRSGVNVAVLFVDLDDFKLINDTYGHEMGDRLLRVVAERLQRHLRVGDTAARFGGDEFLVLLEDAADRESAEDVAERLRDSVAQPVEIAGRRLAVNASVGLAWSAGGNDSAEHLLRLADAAMYEKKAHSKARHAA